MRNLISAIACGFLALVLVSCEKEKDFPVTSVTIGQATAEMLIGETIQLSAKVLPNEASDKTVSWASSKQSVATVSSSGLVTAIAEGSSTITASAGGKSGTCIITVSKKVIEVSSVELDKTSAQLKAGETVTLTATVKPDDATDKTVTWSTSDASVATVNDGVVTAIKVGTATITAKAGDKSATCSITIEATPVTSVSLDQTSASLKVGETVTLKATVKPDDATDKTVTWSTSDASVATINDGVVTAIKLGSATITAKVGDKSATCSITVVPTPVTSIALNKTSASLKVGETVTLTATVKPDDATDKTVTWTTRDASVATVNEGVVTAIKLGSATITAEAGDKLASCVISVIPTPVTSVILDQTSAALVVGETITLTATVKPDDATNKTVTWGSSNESVVTVDANGVLNALNKGKATITVTASENSNLTASCQVIVSNPCPAGAIDLGIKTYDGFNLYWATSNLSINGLCENPEDYGDYYAWGELEPYYDSLNPITWKEGKTNYNWASYRWCNGDYNALTKYCSTRLSDFWGGEGAPDGKTTYKDYDNADDAAYFVLGGNWHTPTTSEWDSLLDNCKHTWVENYNGTGIKGRIFTSKISGYTNKSIFLPCAGGFEYGSHFSGTSGIYWDSRINYTYDRPYEAWYMCLFSSGVFLYSMNRCNGISIRPVTF